MPNTEHTITIYLSHSARRASGDTGPWFVVENRETMSGFRPSMADVIQDLLDAKRMVFEITIIPEHPERAAQVVFQIEGQARARPITDVEDLDDEYV